MHRFGLLIIVTASVFSACSPFRRDEGKTVFRYNEAANITSLDPAFARDQAITWAVNQLFNGLVQLDDRLNVRPCIARRWDISSDGRTYTFHLRRDVRFHDSPVFNGGKGRTVTAADFVYSFRRIINPSLGSPGAWVFNDIARSGDPFLAPDDSTFVLRLERPFPPFLRMLCMQYCSVVPQEAVGAGGQEFGRNPVGTGPFQFKLWKEGIKLVFTRNPNYFERDEGRNLPYLDAVAVTFIPDRQSAFLEFLKGNLDMMSGIDPAYKDELLTPEGKLRSKYVNRIRLITEPYLNTEYLGFMVDGRGPGPEQWIPPRAVRQAVNLAFDRKKMIRYLRNNIGLPGCQGIVPKGLPSFDSTRVFYDYDPERARRLLAEAGYPGGRGLPPLVLTSTPDYLDICKYIQHQVANVGIDLRIEVSQPAAVKEMKAQARLPFFRASWIADYPDAENYLAMFISRNFCPRGPNYTHFANPLSDSLYNRAMETVDDSLRIMYYRQMEAVMMEQAPVVVLYYDQVLRFVQKDVSGLGSNPMNLLTLKRVRKSG